MISIGAGGSIVNHEFESNTPAQIIRPLTGDKMLGFDEFGQLWAAWPTDGGSVAATIIADVRGKTCAICGREWDLNAKSFLDQNYLQHLKEWTHRTCYMRCIAMNEANFWHDSIIQAMGDAEWKWKKLPNQYDGGLVPWYKVQFEHYVPHLILGPRKRVFHLAIHDLTPAQAEQGTPLFGTEDVTHEFNPTSIMIHAWSKDKAQEYLGKFATLIKMDAPIKREPGAVVTRIELPKPNEKITY